MKMKVRLAAKVFSHSFTAGMSAYIFCQKLPAQAAGTADFIKMIDDIFDCVNSHSFNTSKKYRNPLSKTSASRTKIRAGIELFKNLRELEHITGANKTHLLKCLRGWELPLNSILQLWEKLYNDGQASYLLARQLNQDPLENFFGSIRQQGGNSDNPTPVQFKRAYRKLFHCNLLKIASRNCEADDDKPLQFLPSLSEVHVAQSSLAEAPLKLILAEEFSYQLVKNRLLKDNAITYVAGVLLRKSFTKHDCQTCRSFLTNDSFDDDRKVFMFFKEYESDSNAFGGLVVPSKVMIDYVIKLEDTFAGKFQDLNILQRIGKHLLEVLEKEIIDILTVVFQEITC